jgi:hypothetical protein
LIRPVKITKLRARCWATAKSTRLKKGTAVKQNYQTIDAAVTALAVLEGVSVALGEIVADVREASPRP